MRTIPVGAILLLCPIYVACSGSDEKPTLGSGGDARTGGGSAFTTDQGGSASTNPSSLTAAGTPSMGGSTVGVIPATGGKLSVGGSLATSEITVNGGTGSGNTTTVISATGGNVSVGGNTSVGGSATGGKSGGGSSTGGAPMGGSGSGGSSQVAACLTNQVSSCTGTNPIICDFGGNVGDYEVTIELGGAAVGNMYVDAESFRRMLPIVTTAASETKRFSFGVNVRQPEGQPVQAVPAGTPGLQIYVRGTTPRLSSICVKTLKPVPKIWVAGDSTVCDQDSLDFAGWGQHLPRFFGIPISVANYADSGESSGSVLGSAKMWGAIKAGWKAGDWAFVQVGHNDKDTTAATFQSNITAYVTQAKAAGVNIVLVTPISRVGDALANEHVNSTGANLPQIIRDVGKTQNVPVIDLTVTTWNWLQTVTWSQYFALGTDHTHTNHLGADIVAGFVADGIRNEQLSLAAYLR
jgi:lysophospholipase L1-like esterase